MKDWTDGWMDDELNLEVLVKDLKTMEDQVRWLLNRFEDTRNNDFYLIILYMKYILHIPIGFIRYSELRDYSGCITTISRVRRHIQNDDGDLLPSDPEIREARFIKSQNMRKAVKRLKEEKH